MGDHELVFLHGQVAVVLNVVHLANSVHDTGTDTHTSWPSLCPAPVSASRRAAHHGPHRCVPCGYVARWNLSGRSRWRRTRRWWLYDIPDLCWLHPSADRLMPDIVEGREQVFDLGRAGAASSRGPFGASIGTIALGWLVWVFTAGVTMGMVPGLPLGG